MEDMETVVVQLAVGHGKYRTEKEFYYLKATREWKREYINAMRAKGLVPTFSAGRFSWGWRRAGSSNHDYGSETFDTAQRVKWANKGRDPEKESEHMERVRDLSNDAWQREPEDLGV